MARFRLYSYNDKTGSMPWWDSYDTLAWARRMCKVWYADSPSDYLVFDTEERKWFVYHPDIDTLVMA